MRRKKAQDLLLKVKERYRVMTDSDHENRLEGMEDLKFALVSGYQWQNNMLQERGQRPAYEFNKIRVASKRIINDIRANRPSGKIRAVEGGDQEQAETMEGLVRNILNVSDFDTITDYAAEYQVNAGMGAWRVDTEYSDNTAFNQDIVIKGIPNSFTLYCDPQAKDLLKRDAEDWILTEKISIAAYEKKYGKDEIKSDFEDTQEFDDDEDWQSEETVRIAEYFWKEPEEKEIWLLRLPNDEGGFDDKVVDSTTDEARGIMADPELSQMIVRKRNVMTDKIMSCIASGAKILEGPDEHAGHLFPFVMVFGEYVHIDGRPYWWGLPRFAKDAQRSYNVARTSISEIIAQAPKSVFWATAKQAEGQTAQWATAHKKNLPFMLYTHDPKEPGAPKRMGGADVPVALIQESQIASDEIKAVTGIFDESIGQQTNANSGRAIYARQQQGEIATFNYRDNMAKGIQRTYEIILDLIPEIYDTEREMRILGSDGSESYVKINQMVFDPESGKTVRINDMAAGKYDTTVTVGPSFSTLRQEAAEVYGQLSQQFPQLMGVAGDLVFKSMDLPYADDIGERLKTMLPPQIQQMLNDDTDTPPEVQQMMQQAEQAMQQVQKHGQLVQAASAELEQDKALNDKQKAEIQTQLANVAKAKAEFDAHVATQLSNLTKEQVGMVTREAGLAVKSAELKEQAAGQMAGQVGELVNVAGTAETVAGMDEMLAKFMLAVDSAMQGLEQKAGELETKTDRTVVGGSTRQENGRLVADVQYSDGTEKNISAVRENGGLRIVPDSEDI